MTRYARLAAPGCVFHVISRFVNREYRMLGDEERSEYLARVPLVLQHSDWNPLSYTLMSSHVHWAFLAGQQSSASFILPLHSGFAQWLNRKQGRLGPVFAGRHSTILC